MAALAAIWVGLAQTGSALASCNPSRTDNWDSEYDWGYANQTSASWGKVKADVESQSESIFDVPNLAYQYDNHTTALVGLARINGAGYETAFASWGRGYINNGNRELLAFYDGPSFGTEVTLIFSDASSIGDTPTYAVRDEGSSKDMIVNGSVIWSAPSLSFTPNLAQVFGAITSRADQVPGTPGNHEGYTTTQVFTTPNGTGQDLDGTLGGNNLPNGGSKPSWFNTRKASASHYEIWDDCT